MKAIKYVSLSSLIIASLGAAIPSFAAEENVSKEYKSNAIVEFKPDEKGTNPVDPNDPDPDKPVQPWDPSTPNHEPEDGTSGPLSIDFASSLNFGENKITSKTVTYYANPQYLWDEEHKEFDKSTSRPNYVQISDKRGTNAGWTLHVKQEGQLSNKDTLNKELKGAEIQLNNGLAASISTSVAAEANKKIILDPKGETSLVMSAKEASGSGTWVTRFGQLSEVEVDGEKVTKNTDITLTIPGSTPKDAVKYATKLTWILTDQPSNQSEPKE